MISLTAGSGTLRTRSMVAAVCRASCGLASLTFALRSNDFQHS
jgi:hypothetical protein